MTMPEIKDTCSGGLPDGMIHKHVGRCFRQGVKAARATDRPRVIQFLRGLRDATDMPVHHAADIDQFLIEALAMTPEEDS